MPGSGTGTNVQPAATGSKPVPVKSVLKRSNKQERDGYVESARHDGLDPQAVLILEAPVTTRV